MYTGKEKSDSSDTSWVFANLNQVFTKNNFFRYRYYDS